MVCHRRARHGYGGRSASAFAVAAVLTNLAHPAMAADEVPSAGKKSEGWLLPHHSFERTLTYDDRLADWLTSAATMALRDRVQILPPVPDRYGLFWNEKAVDTQDLEISFQFRAKLHPPKSGGPEDGAFAFWLSPDNFTASYDEQAIVTVRNWTKGMEDAGLTFMNNRPNFNGVGVLFLGLDQKGNARPSVTAVLREDASKPELKMTDFPAQEGQVGNIQTKFIDWRKEEVEIKMRATLGGLIVGTLKASKSDSPVEIFRIPADTTKSWLKTYFGFSGFSGSDSVLELDMSRLEVRNFDEKKVGEEKDSLDPANEEIGDVEAWKKMLEEEKRFIDQKGQKEAVEQLTKLLGDYVEKYNKMGEKVKSDLVWLERRMSSLDADVGVLIGASKATDPKTGSVDTSELKEHIVGLKSILQKDKEKHDKKFQQVHQDTQTLKESGGDVLGAEGRAKVASVAEQAKVLEKHVSSGTTQSSSLLLLLILAVCILGVLFLNRMRYYEKKHYF